MLIVQPKSVNENIINDPKIWYNFDTLSKILIFRYCDSNIGLFSIDPYLVIALQTMQ